MTYCEWIMENWQKGKLYQSALAEVKEYEDRIAKLKSDIEMVEHGDTSVLHDQILEKMYSEKQRIAFYLESYRDGKNLRGAIGFYYGSLPYLNDHLDQRRKVLVECAPTKPFDWRELPNYTQVDGGWTWVPYTRDEWYEESIKVLKQMMYCLKWEAKYNFNENVVNFVTDLTKWDIGFSFAHWMVSDGFTTCMVWNRHIPKSKIKQSDWDYWAATLRAVLDYVDLHWSRLLDLSIEHQEHMRQVRIKEKEMIDNGT